jgi:two-component system, chemotaxis family, protein-glutamate methylesterase/glutaminase
MDQHDILVVGASAGGVESLKTLVAGLPESLPAAMFVVLHVSPHVPSHLCTILKTVARVPVENASNGTPIRPGRIYVAVPDHHLLIEQNRLRITRGPRENRSRPAIDVLFRSAAYHFGPRVIGIVLSGNLDDGTAGLWVVKDCGGIAVVQSPEDALFPSMPQNALQQVTVDHVLPVAAMPPVIAGLIRQPASRDPHRPMVRSIEIETGIALDEQPPENASMQLGPLSPNTCPECHGSLFRVQESPILRYRCHVGHAFSHQTLLALISGELDDQFAQMQRVIEERTYLLRDLQQQLGADDGRRAEYARLIAESEQWVRRVRDLIVDQGKFSQSLSAMSSR